MLEAFEALEDKSRIDDGVNLGCDEGQFGIEGAMGINDGWEDGTADLDGVKLGCDESLQSFAQNGPESACTGWLVNVQFESVKMSCELP